MYNVKLEIELENGEIIDFVADLDEINLSLENLYVAFENVLIEMGIDPLVIDKYLCERFLNGQDVKN